MVFANGRRKGLAPNDWVDARRWDWSGAVRFFGLTGHIDWAAEFFDRPPLGRLPKPSQGFPVVEIGREQVITRFGMRPSRAAAAQQDAEPTTRAGRKAGGQTQAVAIREAFDQLCDDGVVCLTRGGLKKAAGELLRRHPEFRGYSAKYVSTLISDQWNERRQVGRKV